VLKIISNVFSMLKQDCFTRNSGYSITIGRLLQLQDTLLDNRPTCNKIFEKRKGASMANNSSDEDTKRTGMNPSVLVAIITAITTIVAAVLAAVLPGVINRPNTVSSPVPVVITVAVVATQQPTETLPPATTEAPTLIFTPTTEPPTATATQQVGVFNIKLATNQAGLNPATKFKLSDPIYLIFDINDPTGLNIVTVRWSVVKVKNFKSDAELSNSPKTIKDNHYAEEFKYNWVEGKYKVELSMNGVTETIEFEIVP
jgi:hypothetical protein